jgi:ADP-ribosyl-[dinitrogen reductase] hydrolase
MSGIEDGFDATEAEAAKVAQYAHLLPPPSAEMRAKMASGQGDGGPAMLPDLPEAAIEPLPSWPALSAQDARDRALGCLLGLAVGDALGAAVEFAPRGSFAPVTDMRGGGPFKLHPGEWTDDTTMALCLADSLLASGTVDQDDLMTRLLAWLREGANTVPGRCFDIGNTTRAAIESFAADRFAAAGSEDAQSAGNGSLVRVAPLAIIAANDPELETLAVRQSRTTHGAAECLDACRLFAAQLADALRGADKDVVLRPRVMALQPRVLFIDAGEYKAKTAEEIHASGYVVHTLEAALWAVWTTGSFRHAVLAAVNLGEDADSVGAVAGQLAGALYGVSAIPPEWLQQLAWRERIEMLAERLFAYRAAPTGV